MLRSTQSGSRPRTSGVKQTTRQKTCGLTQRKSNKQPIARPTDYRLRAAKRRDTFPFWVFQHSRLAIANESKVLTVAIEIEKFVKGGGNLIPGFWIQCFDTSSQSCAQNRNMIGVVVKFTTRCEFYLQLL